jgi:predicted metal-binding membrane protein
MGQHPDFDDRARLTVKTVLASIVLVVVVSWIYLLTGAGMPKMDMGGGQVMLMPPPSWSVSYAAIIFAMWTIMMVAMMLPSAAQTILRIAGRAEGVAPAAFFTAGYLIVWTGFSAVATTLQWAFDSAHLLSDSMAIRSELAASFIVIGVGLYQLSAVKKNCLRRCCSTHFLPDDQVRSASAEVRAGVSYGISCLGCCWALMSLLFVAGVMNFLGIAVIAVWVLAEKTLASGVRIAQAAAVGLIGWGSVTLALAIR